MTLESPAGRAGQIARQMLLFRRPIPTEELVQKINAIGVDTIRSLAADIFTNSEPTVAAVGALDGMMRRDQIVARLGARSQRREKLAAEAPA
jgi:predicted Zn-dependent peptidase